MQLLQLVRRLLRRLVVVVLPEKGSLPCKCEVDGQLPPRCTELQCWSSEWSPFPLAAPTLPLLSPREAHRPPR